MYDSIPSSHLLALAGQILKRAKLKGIVAETREQAIAVIRGVTPAPPRREAFRIAA